MATTEEATPAVVDTTTQTTPTATATATTTPAVTKPLKVVAFNSSPHPVKGNTAAMIAWIFEELQKQGVECEVMNIGNRLTVGCGGCGGCSGKNACVKKQDGGWINEAYQKMLEADAIILASPTHFADVNCEMKSLIDRCGMIALCNGRTLRFKIGAAISAVRRAGSVCAFDSMNHWFFINGMIAVGSTYWNLGIGMGPGEVASDTEAQVNMRDLGKNIAYVLNCMRAYGSAVARGTSLYPWQTLATSPSITTNAEATQYHTNHTETQPVSPSRGVSPARWATNAASASSRTEHAPHAAATRRRGGMLTAETHAGPLVWPPLHEQSPTPNGARHAPAVVVKCGGPSRLPPMDANARSQGSLALRRCPAPLLLVTRCPWSTSWGSTSALAQQRSPRGPPPPVGGGGNSRGL
ncbi:flavodoxin family protein [Pelomyxa schiedti]|nr:flavodoxin family protein [Pelomyxa schiedti]